MQFQQLQSRRDLNGTRGTIVQWFFDRKRYNVRTDKGEVIAVRPQNLLEVETVVKNEEVWDEPTEAEQLVAEGFLQAQRLNGSIVEFQWLNARHDLNGSEGTVIVYLQDRQRYNVKINATGEVIAVKPGSIKTIKSAVYQPPPHTEKRSPLKQKATNQSPVNQYGTSKSGSRRRGTGLRVDLGL